MRKSPLKRIAFLFIIPITLFIGYNIYVSRVDRGPIPTVRAVVISTYSGLNAYDCYKAVSYRRELPGKLFFRKIIGYSDSHTALVGLTSMDGLIVNRHGRSTVVDTGNLPSILSILSNDTIYIPKPEGGRIDLFKFNLNGKRNGNILLDIDNVTLILYDYWRMPLVVSQNGLITAALQNLKTPAEGSHIYLFESDGRLKAHLGLGRWPRFGGNGRYLAYMERELNQDKSAAYDTGHVIIVDLKTNTKRSIHTARPGCFTSCYSRLRDYQMSPDGKSIICSYTNGYPFETAQDWLYLVDLSNDVPKWHKLPICALSGWIVINKVPDLFIRDTKNSRQQ